MRKLILIITLLIVVVACKELPKEKVATNQITDVLTVNYEGLEPYLHKQDDKIHVVNFWATWCAPCIKEMPYFEELGKNYKDKNVEVLLVSLDFPKQKEKKLIPFINKNNIQSKVILLDDPNDQVWIDKISKDWSGALPGTLIYTKDKRKFFEQSFTKEQLIKEVEAFLN